MISNLHLDIALRESVIDGILKLSVQLCFVLVNEHLGLLTPGDHPGTLTWLISSVCAARDMCAVQAVAEMFCCSGHVCRTGSRRDV